MCGSVENFNNATRRVTSARTRNLQAAMQLTLLSLFGARVTMFIGLNTRDAADNRMSEARVRAKRTASIIIRK